MSFIYVFSKDDVIINIDSQSLSYLFLNNKKFLDPIDNVNIIENNTILLIHDETKKINDLFLKKTIESVITFNNFIKNKTNYENLKNLLEISFILLGNENGKLLSNYLKDELKLDEFSMKKKNLKKIENINRILKKITESSLNDFKSLPLVDRENNFTNYNLNDMLLLITNPKNNLELYDNDNILLINLFTNSIIYYLFYFYNEKNEFYIKCIGFNL